MNIHIPNAGSSYSNTDMEILEKPLEWLRSFQDGWLDHLEKTGQKDWKRYTYPQNRLTPNARGVNLSHTRLLLISSVGAFYPGSQKPFSIDQPLGDYTIRQIPITVNPDQLSFSLHNFQDQYIRQDSQVLLPLRHLQNLRDEGLIGSLSPVFISFSGYQPHAIRVVKELIPAILKTAREYKATAALIIPASDLCIQSAGLVARALEVNNITTTLTTWNAEMAEKTAPPRMTATKLPAGSPIGMPYDSAQQRRVLVETLKLLEMDAPTGTIHLNETASL